jgi:uncharacterized protein
MLQHSELRRYSADIITNGYRLTADVASELVGLHVEKFQVTIDGPRRIHDQRRMLRGRGGATFDTIVANLHSVPAQAQIVLRVNVDRQNRDHLEELFFELEEQRLLSRVLVNIAKVEDFAGLSKPPATLLSAREFAALEVDVMETAREHRWPLYVSTPSPRLAGVCQVDSVNSFVVTPTGELLKCFAELGNKGHVVGHLLKPQTWDRLAPTRLTQRDPFDDEECRACWLLPSCLGCCPLLRQNNRAAGQKVCPPMKHNYVRILSAQFGRETRIITHVRDLGNEAASRDGGRHRRGRE